MRLSRGPFCRMIPYPAGMNHESTCSVGLASMDQANRTKKPTLRGGFRGWTSRSSPDLESSLQWAS